MAEKPNFLAGDWVQSPAVLGPQVSRVDPKHRSLNNHCNNKCNALWSEYLSLRPPIADTCTSSNSHSLMVSGGLLNPLLPEGLLKGRMPFHFLSPEFNSYLFLFKKSSNESPGSNPKARSDFSSTLTPIYCLQVLSFCLLLSLSFLLQLPPLTQAPIISCLDYYNTY